MTERYDEMARAYIGVIEEIEKRILALPHSQVLETKDVWDLFKIEGFTTKDLEPSLGQASIAYNRAKRKLREEKSA